MIDLSQIFGSEKTKEIITDSLMIKDNILKFDKLTLQLSNVSMLDIGEREFQIPWRAFGIGFISFLLSLFMLANNNSLLFLICIGIAALAGYYIWKMHDKYLQAKYYLKFFLNSGNHYSLFKKEIPALEQIKDVIEAAFNNQSMNVSYYIQDSQIIHTENTVSDKGQVSVNVGTQGNVVMNQTSTTAYSNDTNHFVNSHNTVSGDFHAEGMVVNQGIVTKFLADQKATWEDVANELKFITHHLPENSEEKLLSEKVLHAAQEKDDKTVCTLVENNAATFFTGIFKNATETIVGSLVVQMINYITGMK